MNTLQRDRFQIMISMVVTTVERNGKSTILSLRRPEMKPSFLLHEKLLLQKKQKFRRGQGSNLHMRFRTRDAKSRALAIQPPRHIRDDIESEHPLRQRHGYFQALLFSRPFFSHCNGYKLVCMLAPFGDGEGTVPKSSRLSILCSL